MAVQVRSPDRSLALGPIVHGAAEIVSIPKWHRHTLVRLFKEILLDPRGLGRSYIDRRQLEAMVSAHSHGTGNSTTAIHKLMTCEFIERELIDHQ